ncbi:MAG: hypothetical protein AB8E15_08320 [Bdellovibrionales bacterium]
MKLFVFLIFNIVWIPEVIAQNYNFYFDENSPSESSANSYSDSETNFKYSNHRISVGKLMSEEFSLEAGRMDLLVVEYEYSPQPQLSVYTQVDSSEKMGIGFLIYPIPESFITEYVELGVGIGFGQSSLEIGGDIDQNFNSLYIQARARVALVGNMEFVMDYKKYEDENKVQVGRAIAALAMAF